MPTPKSQAKPAADTTPEQMTDGDDATCDMFADAQQMLECTDADAPLANPATKTPMDDAEAKPDGDAAPHALGEDAVYDLGELGVMTGRQIQQTLGQAHSINANAGEIIQRAQMVEHRANVDATNILNTVIAKVSVNLKQYDDVDWGQMREQDPQWYKEHRPLYDADMKMRRDLMGDVEQYRAAMAQYQQQQYERACEQATSRAEELLCQVIPDFCEETLQKAADFVGEHYGVSYQEMFNMPDARLIKMAYDIWQLSQNKDAASKNKTGIDTIALDNKDIGTSQQDDPATYH